MKRHLKPILMLAILLALVPTPAYAMHVSEGILPLSWAGVWFVVALPFIFKGVSEIKKSGKRIPAFMPLTGMIAAAVFIISAMPIPVPYAGSCSHPAGTGLAAIMIGPFATSVAASVALLIQALFLAHGGISTWGANVVSMGIIGAFSGYFAFKLSIKMRLSPAIAAFMAGLVSDWATYTMTALELALGLNQQGSFLGLFKAIFIAFIPTQLPLGILEGFAAAGFFAFVLRRRPDILMKLRILPEGYYVRKGASYEEAVS